MVRTDGADLSHWQDGALDFVLAKKADLRFVYHKATEGTNYVDPNYLKRRHPVAAAGLPYGAYHFARLGQSDGAAQARFFLSQAKPLQGDMIPMLDLEVADGRTAKQLTDWAGDFITTVRKATGSDVIVYTPFDLLDDFDCPLWVARYSNTNALPRIPKPWSKATIWQFTDGLYGTPTSHPGLGKVDLNYLMTDDPASALEDLRIGFSMPTMDQLKADLVPAVVEALMHRNLFADGSLTVASALRQGSKADEALAALNGLSAAVAKAVVAALPPASTAPACACPTLTPDAVRQAVEAGLRSVLGSLDKE